MIYLLPFAIAISLGTYQPTLSFLFEVVFLHFLIRCFKTNKFNAKKEIRFYGFFGFAVLGGCALYYFLVKILLTIAGIPGWLRRGEVWHNKVFNNLIDLISYAFDSFKWFIFNGVSSGINPSDSVLVGHISLREPLIMVYQMTLLIVNLLLVFQSLLKRSKLQICLSIGVLPLTILITILPLVVSGSTMISRAFYPFGLLLPAFLLIQMEKKHKSSSIAGVLALIFIVLLGTFQSQVFNGMANGVRFAREEHQEMLSRLFVMPNYSVNDEVLIYPYIPDNKERSEVDNSRFWPLYFPYNNLNQIFKIYHNYAINMINLKDLKEEEINKIDNFISANKIQAWPYFNSVTYIPDLRKGVFIIYYPYTVMIERTGM